MNKPNYIIKFQSFKKNAKYTYLMEFGEAPTIAQTNQIVRNLSWLFSCKPEDIDITSTNLGSKQAIKSLAEEDIRARKQLDKLKG